MWNRQLIKIITSLEIAKTWTIHGCDYLLATEESIMLAKKKRVRSGGHRRKTICFKYKNFDYASKTSTKSVVVTSATLQPLRQINCNPWIELYYYYFILKKALLMVAKLEWWFFCKKGSHASSVSELHESMNSIKCMIEWKNFHQFRLYPANSKHIFQRH